MWVINYDDDDGSIFEGTVKHFKCFESTPLKTPLHFHPQIS